MSTLKANALKPISTSGDLKLQTNDTTRVTLSGADGLVKLADSSPGIKFGDGYVQEFAGGKIRQVVTMTTPPDDGGGNWHSTTSTSLVDTGIQATITPKSASSCIYIDAMISAGGTVNNFFGLGIRRGSTDIALGVAGNNRTQATAGANTRGLDDIQTVPIKFFDNPNTTSELTYKITFNARSGYTTYINRTSSDSDSQEHVRPISTITLMEIVTGAQ